MQEVGEPVLLQTLRGHRGEVTCADAAGARLVTGGGDRTLRLWRWAATRGWEAAATAPGAHRYGVTAARWAPGGILLCSGGVDGAVRVWCGRSLAARRALVSPRAAAVRALCWAGRARALAGHDDGALCVWHVPRAQLLARLLQHEGALHAVAAPAPLLLTSCTDGVLKVFDLAEVCRSGAEGSSPPVPLTWVDGAHDLGALCADATEDGSAAATGGQDGVVRVWAVRTDGVAGGPSLVGHGAAVTALRWARGSVLASGSLDRSARLWDARRAACLHVLPAHTRYLTCIVLAHDLSYMISGSNDKSVRMWSLGSLTLEDELELPCAALEHFGLGDLEGIGPLEEIGETEAAPLGDEDAEGSGARCLHRAPLANAAPINCVATHDNLLATASSDGWVRVYQWNSTSNSLEILHELEAHQYPAMAVDFGAGGAILLSAGLDGLACLWDVQSGVQLRTLSTAGYAGVDAGGEAGGGGVRGARISPQRPTQLLLATDDGLAPLWTLDALDPRPTHVYAGHTEAVMCCAWSGDGRVLATGAASGELRLQAPPPIAILLHHESHAHDLGVQSCDFAPECAREELDLPEFSYLLATAGCDSTIKLWIVETQQEDGRVLSAAALELQCVEAHGGGAASVRWSAAAPAARGLGALLASAGADRWARVWRVEASGCALRPAGAAPAAGAGGVLAVALLARASSAPLLVSGTLAGELAIWQLPLDEQDGEDEDEGAPPCLWGQAGVTRWIRENITRAPGAAVTHEEEVLLIQRAIDTRVTGTRLINDSIDDILEDLGYGGTPSAEEESERDAMQARLREELEWLRRAPPSVELEREAAHALLCPLSHRLLRCPARAADGYSYERANILDWFIAAEGAVSPISALRLRNARVLPNYALRDQLRQFLRDREPPPAPDPNPH